MLILAYFKYCRRVEINEQIYFFFRKCCVSTIKFVQFEIEKKSFVITSRNFMRASENFKNLRILQKLHEASKQFKRSLGFIFQLNLNGG